ncbi:MAG: glycosyltransferase family 4 protein [Chlamydiae bacterium]|nr:glycosyltransferase family 4 protein [Chlamydiota bacterium]
MKILHTESSNGWGGQEIRILKEAEGMRKRGHSPFFAVTKGGGLVSQARKRDFLVYELNFGKKSILRAIIELIRIIRIHQIDLINTHSSLDSWIGGIVGKMTHTKILRTRHLSTEIKGGLNSFLLYGYLADSIVTTSSCAMDQVLKKAKISKDKICSIATGVDVEEMTVELDQVNRFRECLGIKKTDFLVGTACFVRSWKGVEDMMRAAQILKGVEDLKWVVIGGGYVDRYKGLVDQFGIKDRFFFTGHLEIPYPAIASLDIFLLLSTAHEGISQSSLQAAYLERPLITTNIGGLPEVCLENNTGILVDPHSPEQVANAIIKLKGNSKLRLQMGMMARQLVEERFTLAHTLDQMEMVYKNLKNSSQYNFQ